MPLNSGTKLIVASASLYKRMLLERLGLAFECQNPDIDESIRGNEAPEAAAARLAREKAEKIVSGLNGENAIVIACDQVAYLAEGCSGVYLGKPGTPEKAREQLSMSSGKIVNFFTAFHIIDSSSGQVEAGIDQTEVEYRQLRDDEIADYLSREDVLDCAGSAKVEGLGISLLEKVKSEDPTALIGLPLIRVNKALIKLINEQS